MNNSINLNKLLQSVTRLSDIIRSETQRHEEFDRCLANLDNEQEIFLASSTGRNRGQVQHFIHLSDSSEVRVIIKNELEVSSNRLIEYEKQIGKLLK